MLGFRGAAGARLAAWRRRHPWQVVLGLVLLTALLGWTGYRAWSYFAARGHLQAARQALDRHEWSEARAHLDTCLRAWPDSPAAHLLAARAARRLGSLDDARSHLDTCRQLQGGDTQAAKVERALLRVQGGDLAGAEAFLRGCVARDDPDAVEILDVLSAALILDYRVPEADRCLADLLRRQPDNFDMLVRRARTARSQGWYSVAAASLRKALDLRPDTNDVRLALAQDLVILGRFPDARQHLTQLHEKEPDNPAVTFALARCLAEAGQRDRAGTLLDGLLAREPDNWTVLRERGWLSLQLDRAAEAERYLRRAQAVAPPDQTLLTRLADCLRLLGKPDEARQYREEADRLRADRLRALGLSKRIREEGPKGPDLYHELACVLLRLGKKQDALHFFHKALEKDPSYRPAHESLAAFYETAGAPAQAAYHRRKLGRQP